MTTQLATAPTDGPDRIAPVVPPTWRVTEVVSAMATRLSFLAVAWLLLVAGAGWVRTAGVLAVMAVAYVGALAVGLRALDRGQSARTSIVADLVSAVAFGTVALVGRDLVGLIVAVAVLGAARAASDLAKGALSGQAAAVPPAEATDPEVPPRDRLLGLLVAVVGAAAGAVAAWLGAAGPLWLLSMLCAVAAARVALAAAPEPLGEPTVDATGGTDETDASAGRPRLVLPGRTLAVLFGTGLLAFTGAATLVAVWARAVFEPAGTDALDALGLLGGAFVVGAVAWAVAFTAGVERPLRHLLFALGFLAGAAAMAVFAGERAALLLVVVVAVLAGAATASIAPVTALGPALTTPTPRRPLVNAVAATATHIGVPLGAAAAGALVPRLSVVGGVATAAGLLLAALLLPILAHRTWRTLTPALERPVTVLRRHPRLPARLSVTLAYGDGQWVAELRRGRALIGRRYLVNSTEALNMLSVLDVPALTDRVEQALTVDKTEASRQVERLRTELAELETKLNGLTGMMDLSERGKPT